MGIFLGFCVQRSEFECIVIPKRFSISSLFISVAWALWIRVGSVLRHLPEE